MKINGNKKIEFTPQGISYVLDALTLRPFREVHVLIGDIMNQLKLQEGGNDGPQFNRSGETLTGRGNSSSSDSGVSPMESECADH